MVAKLILSLQNCRPLAFAAAAKKKKKMPLQSGFCRYKTASQSLLFTAAKTKLSLQSVRLLLQLVCVTIQFCSCKFRIVAAIANDISQPIEWNYPLRC